MRRKLEILFRIVFGRTAIVIVSILAQIAFMVAAVSFLSDYSAYIYGGFTLLSAVILIYILNEETNSSFKIAWMIPVLIIPVFGAILYIFVNVQIGTKVIKKRLEVIDEQLEPLLMQDMSVMDNIEHNEAGEVGFMNYLSHTNHFNVYSNTSVEYFPLGDDKFPELLAQLHKAKRYIFLEYFIVSRGVMWNAVLEVLKQKVQEGVEVRFMYDGMCCLALLPYNYPKEMERYGIKCKMFSPIKPVLSTYQNNRDHRKILVIDGHTAFTGGVNLADEYINREVRFGHWKDTSIMLQGDAVQTFTLMFLEMWNVSENVKDDYEKYLKITSEPDIQEVIASPDYIRMQSGRDICTGGYIVPYGDGPFNGEEVGKQVYIDILNRAQKYVHIMTPYLILDDEMLGALTYAAKRGVDTVIIMPHIPDKVYAYLLARTYYKELIEHGVKIYEYTPGFVHAKVFVSDDEKAVVGSINLDFRSLYLHFECAAYIYKNTVIQRIEEDYELTIAKCSLITLQDCKKLALWKKAIGRILRIVAPLM